MEKTRKPRADSKMYQLPKEVMNQVNDMLLNDNMKYSDIQYWLETEHHVKISLSSISNYAVRIFKAAQRTADELERTKYFVDMIGDKSDIDASRAASAILKSGLLQKISTAEEEFNEMPIERAGRLLVEINKTELAEKRLELDYKKEIAVSL
ncbi:MAG: phage protein Gp27 family protein [Eisenbergiella massiliensis]